MMGLKGLKDDGTIKRNSHWSLRKEKEKRVQSIYKEITGSFLVVLWIRILLPM